MRTIPVKMRNELSADRFMSRCCINNAACEGRVEWHHVWIYAGKQINEPWAIVPACEWHHRQANKPAIKILFEIASLRRAKEEDLAKYPKKDWKQIKNYIKNI